MLLLITGASGMGKTTVRKIVAAQFADQLESAELAEVAGPPEWSLRWRHQAVEKAVQRAVKVQRDGKHFLLCGDPVPPAEVYAAPSADQPESIAVCLLDASEDSQRLRLMDRGDAPSLIPNHIAFARWMREHIANPRHRLDVIKQGGWEEMQWDRWITATDQQKAWKSHRIDTTGLDPVDVGELAATWIRQQMLSIRHQPHFPNKKAPQPGLGSKQALPAIPRLW